jgi:transcription initiation factor TFIID TATA-box-binding protein
MVDNHPSGIMPVLLNVVAAVNLACTVDLVHLATHARNAEYNPRNFVAVVMRIRDPRASALVYSSGKMVVTGARTEYLAHLAARKFARIIQKVGIHHVKFQDFKVTNMLASCELRFPLRLEGIALAYPQQTMYEPEVFSGLVYKMSSPRVSITLFVTGKVVILGASHRDQIYEAFENIYPILTEFRRQLLTEREARSLHAAS